MGASERATFARRRRPSSCPTRRQGNVMSSSDCKVQEPNQYEINNNHRNGCRQAAEPSRSGETNNNKTTTANTPN